MGNKLKSLRNEKGLSTQSLSKVLNINNTTLNRLENGITSLNEQYIQIFCEFYDVTSDYLLGLSPHKKNSGDYKSIKILPVDNLNSEPIGYIQELLNPGDSIEDLFYVKPTLYNNCKPFITENSLILISKKPHKNVDVNIIFYNNGTLDNIKPIFTYPIYVNDVIYYEPIVQTDHAYRYSELKPFNRSMLIGFVRKIIHYLAE